MKAMKPIYESPEKVMVTGGSVRIVNGSYIQNGQMIENRLPKQPLALMQIIEYLRGFLFGRLAWSKYNILPIISGAFGIFDKGEVIRVGGYQRKLSEKIWNLSFTSIKSFTRWRREENHL